MKRWWYRLRLALSEWIRPEPHEGPPDGWPEVGRPAFDDLTNIRGSYWLDLRFTEGTEPREMAASILNAAAFWFLMHAERNVAVKHLAYRVRVRWIIDFRPIDPARVLGPAWDGVTVRNLVAHIRGATFAPKDGEVVLLPPRTP